MMKMSGSRALLMIGVAASALAAAPAFAADAAKATATTAPAADPTPATDPTPAAEPDQLQDIVVTATKRETNLQKTPIAISVLDPEAIKDRHVQSLLDLGDGAVPSLRVATFEARQSALTIGIRGIVPFDQNQTARDSGVGVYIDGVYLGRSQGLNAALFDVQRIEVLRGPQGTLFGRNTEGGALSIVTKAPTGEFGGRVTAGFGNYGARNGEAHIDLPEYQNISIKLDGVYQHQDATTRNPLAGQLGWNAYDRVGGRIAARWKPTDSFTADVAFDKARDENTPFFSQLINYNPLGRTVGVLDRTTNRIVLPGRSFKQPSLEIGAQAISEHRHVQHIADMRQLRDLCGGEELRLVNQYAGERAARLPIRDTGREIGRALERRRRCLQSDPAGDCAVRKAIVHRRGEQHRLHPPLTIVEVRLQQRGRLPRIHRGVVEIELGHQKRRYRGSRGSCKAPSALSTLTDLASIRPVATSPIIHSGHQSPAFAFSLQA